MPDILGGLMGEIKQHPWTTLSSGIALAGMLVMFPSYMNAGEITRRIASIEATQTQQIKETLSARLGGLRSSLFDTKAKIDEIRARGEQPDPIYFAELKRLNNEIFEVEQQLADMP